MLNGVLEADCALPVPTTVKTGSNERVSIDFANVYPNRYEYPRLKRRSSLPCSP